MSFFKASGTGVVVLRVVAPETYRIQTPGFWQGLNGPKAFSCFT